MASEAAKKTAAPAKAPATNKDGSPRKAPVRKALKPLDFSQVKVTAIADKSKMREFKRTRGERDKEQLQIDNLVRQAHERWVAAGSPEVWEDCPGLHFRVPVDQFETLETRARRAGAYFDLAIRFGDRKVKDGYAEVVLVAKDKSERDNSSDDEASNR